jgi:hypothetical protein
MAEGTSLGQSIAQLRYHPIASVKLRVGAALTPCLLRAI